MEKICIFGGSGFIGKNLTQFLLKKNIKVVIPTRNRSRTKSYFYVLPNVDIETCNIYNLEAICNVTRGCDIVVNLIGILNEGKDSTFLKIHRDVTSNIVKACIKNKIKKFIHLSAIGASDSAPSKYLRSKASSESCIIQDENKFKYTIIRPSVVFGEDDKFFNLFSKLIKYFPILPLSMPNSLFQPIFVHDLVNIIHYSIINSTFDNQILEIGGPKVYTLNQIIKLTCSVMNKRRIILPLNNKLSLLQGYLGEIMPFDIISRDNIFSMEVPSISENDFLKKVDINLKSVEEIIPMYIK